MSQKYGIKNVGSFSLVNSKTGETLLQEDAYMNTYISENNIEINKDNLKHLKVSATISDGNICETDIYVTEQTYNELIEINKKLNKE